MLGFLFIGQFAENDVFQIYPSPYKGHELIVFYVCIVFHGLYVHIFFVQSVTDGYLGWFQVFSIVNRAAMNIHVHVSLL